MSAFIEISIPIDLYDDLCDQAVAENITLTELADRAIGTETDWKALMDRRRMPTVIAGPVAYSQVRAAPIFCTCCAPAKCQNQLFWRGKYRCSCTPERLEAGSST